MVFLFCANFVSAQDTLVIIGSITAIGNKTTKDQIIMRELTVKSGDTIVLSQLPDLLKRSEENLYNTALFNSTKVNYLRSGNSVALYVMLTERWYIFPLPILEIVDRNFNEWWQTKDLSRLNYGGYLVWNNFRGRRETFTTSVKWGYTRKLGFSYVIPFISKRQQDGLGFYWSFAQTREVAVRTLNNRYDFYNNDQSYVRREQGGSITYTRRPGLYQTHTAELGYRTVTVQDTVIAQNPLFFLSTGDNSLANFSVKYTYKIDHRDIRPYPLKGYFLEAEVGKAGLQFLGDKIDLYNLGVWAKKYWTLTNRWYAALGYRAKWVLGKEQPYYYARSLGIGRDVVRGYELYLVDGQTLQLFKSNLKFKLLGTKNIKAGFIPIEKFSTIPMALYLNLFGDAAFVQDTQHQLGNPLSNTWLYGYGMGLDLVTYYDIVFRVDYSFNKQGQSGFFLHFNAPF
jgi:outer membrane protein assembly factor BamA